jgi:hypothetical protein
MSFLTSTGAGVVDRLAYVGGLTIQCITGVRAIPRIFPIMGKRGRWNAAIRQMYAIGVAAVPMVAIVGACAGLILAIQSATVLNQLPGTAALFGGITVGRVSTVRPDTTGPTRIAISLEVSQSTPLNCQSVAEVGSVSPMSAPVLTISGNEKHQGAELMTNGRLIDEKTGLERARALAQ